MRFAALVQKFEVVSESHWFLYRFVILNRVIVINACLYTYALDSSSSTIITFKISRKMDTRNDQEEGKIKEEIEEEEEEKEE